VWTALLREKEKQHAPINYEVHPFAALCRGGTAAAPFGFSLLSLSSRWFDFLFDRRCVPGVTTGKSVQGGIGCFLDRAYLLHLQFFVSHPDFSLDVIGASHLPGHEYFHFFLAPSSFEVNADSRIVVYRNNHCNGNRSLGSFLEVLFPDFRKGTYLGWSPLFLFLRHICRKGQIHKRGMPESASRLALILRRSIHAGFFYRSFVTSRGVDFSN